MIKVGQIRVWKQDENRRFYECYKIDEMGCYFRWVNDYGELKYCATSYLFENVKEFTEIVTIENIREGEWVECIDGEGWTFNTGDKFEVRSKQNDRCVLISDNNDFYVLDREYDYFKPCLPPTNNIDENVDAEEINELKSKEEWDKAYNNLIHDIKLKRRKAIADAVINRMADFESVPIEWIEEYNELCEEVE